MKCQYDELSFERCSNVKFRHKVVMYIAQKYLHNVSWTNSSLNSSSENTQNKTNLKFIKAGIDSVWISEIL